MKTRIHMVIIILSLCILSSCSNKENTIENTITTISPSAEDSVFPFVSPPALERTNGASPAEEIALTDSEDPEIAYDIEKHGDWHGYEIANNSFTSYTELADGLNRYVDVDFPCIMGLDDIEKQDRINKLLRNEAFWYFGIWGDIDDALENVSLSVEYDILFQSNKYLCVNFAGMFFGRGAAHPLHLFYNIIIDMATGHSLKLSDIVNIDSALVNTVRDYFKLYIDDNIRNTVKFSNELMQQPESAFILAQELEDHDEDEFIKWFMNSDSNSDDSFYFTKDVFGFSFPIQYAAGCHYEIEIKREDIEKHLIVTDLFD